MHGSGPVDPREHRKALQSSLRAARAAIAAGDRARALDAVDLALALDPQFLAAQSLRDQIVSGPDRPVDNLPHSDGAWSDVTESAPVFTEYYARFEERAKRRRVQRRLDAARDAIAHSHFEEASAAVEELRELDPGLADLPTLTSAIVSGRTPRTFSRWRLLTLAAAMVGVAVLILTMFVPPAGWLQTADLPISVPVSAPPPAPVELPSVVEPIAVDPTATVAPPAELSGSVDIPVATNLESESRDQDPALTRIPQPVRPESVTINLPTPTPTTLPPPPTPTPTVTPPTQLPPIGAGLPSSGAQLSERPVGSVASTPSAPSPSPPPRPAPAIDDEQLVEQTLQRYRWAYESLDAVSAHAVWPAVDQAALARAFDGLTSQALTFQNCDVHVDGTVATAICGGSVRYVPKVGSREPRIEPRQWTFALRKIEAAWQIESARTER